MFFLPFFLTFVLDQFFLIFFVSLFLLFSILFHILKNVLLSFFLLFFLLFFFTFLPSPHICRTVFVTFCSVHFFKIHVSIFRLLLDFLVPCSLLCSRLFHIGCRGVIGL